MHVFEVIIKKDRKPGQTDFIWPEWWKEVAEKVDVVVYEDAGKPREGAICVCDDETWDLIAAKKDKGIAKLSEEEANAKGRAWRPQTTVVTNQVAAIKAASKVALGKELTDEEKKALDPDDPTPGISKTPLFDIRKYLGE
jgi:hypothetical protein